MKNRNNITTAALISVLLPLGAFAQAGGSQSQQSGAQNPSYPQTSVGTTTGYHGSGGANEVKKIKGDKLEKRMTADRLIGTKVVDREGNKIGEIKDIGLTAALPAGFSSENDADMRALGGQAGHAGQQAGRVSGQASANVSTPSVGFRTGNEAGTSQSAAGATRSGTAGMSAQAGSSSGLVLFVSTDGDNLLQVPASRATFDADKKELKLNIGKSEIEAATEAGDRLTARD